MGTITIVIAINADGHLAVNGETSGNYKVRLDNATGKGGVADYRNKELIRVYDNNADTRVSFTAASRADLGAYTYQAQQKGDTVVLNQERLTDYANMALSIPSANTNIWNLQQDTVGFGKARQTRQMTSSANSPATPSNSTHSSNDTSSKGFEGVPNTLNSAGHNYP